MTVTFHARDVKVFEYNHVEPGHQIGSGCVEEITPSVRDFDVLFRCTCFRFHIVLGRFLSWFRFTPGSYPLIPCESFRFLREEFQMLDVFPIRINSECFHTKINTHHFPGFRSGVMISSHRIEMNQRPAAS